jgi:hypothetical protein
MSNNESPSENQPGWASPQPTGSTGPQPVPGANPQPGQPQPGQPGQPQPGSPQPTNFPQPASPTPINPGNGARPSVTPQGFPQPEYAPPTGFPQQGQPGAQPGFPGQAGYPPAQGYPPQQGFPQQGQQGVPQQGFPQQGAQQGYQQAGFPPGSQGPWAQAPKKRRWPKILLLVFVLFALLIGGCSFLVFRSVRPIVDRGNQFVAALYEGGTAAKAFACPNADVTTEELNDLGKQLKASGWRGAKTLLASGVASEAGQVSTATVSGTLPVTGGTKTIEIDLQKPDKWCVVSVEVGGVTASTPK